MEITPDRKIIWQWQWIELNATIFWTWGVMAILILISLSVARELSDSEEISPLQNMLEVLVTFLSDQITDISQQKPGPYLPFIGTLFIFIAGANILSIVPGYISPMSSLSTTTALAVCVFVAVPFFGIINRGISGYLKQYLQPTPLMLPFNIISEVSRTIALAIRLYGNAMSGAMIVAILISIIPFFFPVVMQLIGLLTGIIQAYIFSVLAMVYIVSAAKVHTSKEGIIKESSDG